MTGKKYPVCRRVMSPSGRVEIVNKLTPLVNALEKQGSLKKSQRRKTDIARCTERSG